MLTLIKNGEVYSPDYIGQQDILIAGGKIAAIAPHINIPPGVPEAEEIDASAMLVLPGFIDQHVHITGGGGEGGPATRTPEIGLSQLTTAGITTVVGLLGIDGITRSMAELLAKARALEEEGISTYIFTGAYEIPTRTLTGNVRSDLALIDKVIGTGEIAISDHRSAQPTLEMLVHLAAETRVGGLLGKKAGIVHIHVGEGKQGLALLFDVIEKSDLPMTQFVPTHINRLRRLFREATAFLERGGTIDLTAGITPEHDSPESLEVARALRLLADKNTALDRVTVSSDGNGSLPVFDDCGNLVKMGISSVKLLWEDVSKAVRLNILPLPQAVSLITRNVAGTLRLLPRKGQITVGSDADIVFVDRDLNIKTVLAGGKMMVEDGQPVKKGYFE